MFAELGSTPYHVVLFLHIVAVVIGFAPAWLTPALARLTAAGDREAGHQMELTVLRYSLPGVAVAGLLGFGLAGMSKLPGATEASYKMSQAWLSIAIVLWLALLAVLVFVARPAMKAMAAGDASARGRVMAATGVTHLVLLVIVFLMVFKPGGPNFF